MAHLIDGNVSRALVRDEDELSTYKWIHVATLLRPRRSIGGGDSRIDRLIGGARGQECGAKTSTDETKLKFHVSTDLKATEGVNGVSASANERCAAAAAGD